MEVIDITEPDFDGGGFGKKSYAYQGDESIEVVSSPSFQKNFIQGKHEFHSLPTSNNAFWVKIVFFSSEKERKIYIYSSGTSRLSVYDETKELLGFIDFSTPLDKRNIVINLSGNKKKTLFISRTFKGQQIQDWTYWLDRIKLLSAVNDTKVHWSIIMSIYVMILLFSGLLLFAYREILYVFYIPPLLGTAFFTTVQYSIFPLNNPGVLLTLSGTIAYLFMTLFTISFLAMKEKGFVICYKISKVILVFIFINIIIIPLSPHLADRLFHFVGSIGAFSGLVIAIYIYIKTRATHVLIYVCGYGTVILGGTFQSLIWQNYFPNLAGIINNMHTYASCLQNVLMLTAMGHKIYGTEKERIKSHNELIEANAEVLKSHIDLEKSHSQLQESQSELKKYVGHVEELVQEKTRQISTIMTHIKQGIFNILPGPKIEKNYSDFLETIVDTKDLEGKNPMDLILNESDLSEDDLSRASSSLEASLGSASFNFLMNSDHLPQEITFNRKTLEMNWQNIEHQGITEKILVVARDITKLKALEEQNQVHKEEMTLIEQIIAVPKDKCQQFLSLCQNFQKENKRLLDRGADLCLPDQQTVFINYHTMKGSARGLKFKTLVDALHTAEHYCALIRKDNSQWNHQTMLDNNESVDTALSRYINLSKNKLGREHQQTGKVFDIETIEDMLKAFSKLSEFDRNTHTSTLSKIHQSYYQPSKEVFDDIFSQIPILAKDLKKEIPHINISGPAIDFTHEATTLLKNVFTHLVRNAMDHGLETSEERKKKDKNPQGTLILNLNPGTDGLTIHFSDDGRGLNLPKIKEMAIANKLLTPEENNPAKIAEMIFHPGLSTAADITDISGRGVGMDAVKSYTEQAGGKLSIHFLQINPQPNKPTPIEFQLILTPNLFTIPR